MFTPSSSKESMTDKEFHCPQPYRDIATTIHM